MEPGSTGEWPKMDIPTLAELEHFASRAPKTTRRTPAAVEQHLIDLRQQHPTWGKQRIADELAKANRWRPLVSPATVRRILRDASLWPTPATAAKKRASQP
jgi:hypothetical protein